MYLADSVGYLGFAAIMVAKTFLPAEGEFLPFFRTATMWTVVFSLLALAFSALYFRKVLSDSPMDTADDQLRQTADSILVHDD
ncbi:MAG: DUF5690 family protein, partial [Planctomycetaceae bacterium]